MNTTRRKVLLGLGSSLTAGCLTNGGGGEDDGGATPTPGGGSTSPRPSDCDPADVRRPPIVEGPNESPMGYGTKPQELTEQSVADYLADFETTYAWNRILVEHAPLTNIGVNTTTPGRQSLLAMGFSPRVVS